jgi:osmotically-inducible protein OsmY
MDPRSSSTISVLPGTGYRRLPLPETQAEAERLAASIERAVWRETSGGVRDLRVEIDRNGVLLTGHCTTYYTKQKAQHAAMGVSGTRQLVNEIDVV